MLLTSRHLPGLALAPAVTLIASVAMAAPITLVSGGGAPAALDTQYEMLAGIDDGTGVKPLSSWDRFLFSADRTLDDPSAGIDLVAMDDLVVQEPLVASEPTSLVLTGLGLILLAALCVRRRHRRHRHRHRLHRRVTWGG